MNNDLHTSWRLFFKTVSTSWFVFGIITVPIEMWRPGFVTYLIPAWFIFFVAGVAGIASLNKK